MNLRSIHRLVAGFSALLLTSCVNTITTSEPVALSDTFAIKTVSGGWEPYTWKSNDIYERLPDNRLRYIGTSTAGGPGGVSFLGDAIQGLHASTLAISEDGRTILFRHYPSQDPRAPQPEYGIFQYTQKDKIRLLYPQDELSGLSFGRQDKPLPRGILTFQSPTTYTPDDLTWALTTSGDVFPLGLLGASRLHWAAFEGRTIDCTNLVKNGADINAETYWDFTPLDLAIIRDHQDTAIHLLDLGAIPESGKYPVLPRAVALGRAKVVQALLEQGVNVNTAGENGYTPLHVAIFAGSRLDSGIHSFFNNAETPRSIMDENMQTILIELLMEHGADPNIPDNYGKTPLDILDATEILVTREFAADNGEDWETLNNAIKAKAKRMMREGY